MLLGDFVHKALSLIGVTPERVSAVFGDCNCKDKQFYLNQLHRWGRMCVGKLLMGLITVEDCRRHYNDLFSSIESENQVEGEKKDG